MFVSFPFNASTPYMLYVVQLNKLYWFRVGCFFFLLSKIWQILNLILDARWSRANLYPVTIYAPVLLKCLSVNNSPKYVLCTCVCHLVVDVGYLRLTFTPPTRRLLISRDHATLSHVTPLFRPILSHRPLPAERN